MMRVLQLRTLVFAGLLLSLLLLVPAASTAQAPGVLRVRIVLADAAGRPAPVPRHALLVGENPPSAPPRRIVTGLDGSVQVALPPGNYTVESDRPLPFAGRRYHWIETVDVPAGGETVLELTAANAEISDGGASDALPESDTSVLLQTWRDSVVGIWTATTHASGFLVDPAGLVVTHGRGIGAALPAEVQFTRERKVAARVLAADAARDVAILQVHAAAIAGIRAVPLDCTSTAQAPEEGARLFTIGEPTRGEKDATTGVVRGVTPAALATDFYLPAGSAGGPVFSTAGTLVGLTSPVEGAPDGGGRDSRVVRIAEVCAILPRAVDAMKTGAPPAATLLPVEPSQPFPVEALEASLERRTGNLTPYTLSSADFDIVLLTPPVVYGELRAPATMPRTTSKDTRSPTAELSFQRRRMEFGGWSEYVAEIWPVLLVRITPRFAEGFWAKVGRIAAETQGVALPPIKRYKSDFVRLQALCGTAEVTPIHPFALETPVSERATIEEGLYVFDPGALGPHCGSVTLVLHAAARPGEGDRRVVDAKIIEQVWQDFEPYRKATAPR